MVATQVKPRVSWKGRCGELTEHYGALLGLVDALLEGTLSGEVRCWAEQERDRLVRAIAGVLGVEPSELAKEATTCRN